MESYSKEHIELRLGIRATQLRRAKKELLLSNREMVPYDTLVIATGGRPRLPNVPGIDSVSNVFPLRNLIDAENIKECLAGKDAPKVVIIGGGYIGLEVAASLSKKGARVRILEKGNRILERVTSKEMSSFFQDLHRANGVDILTNKEVISFVSQGDGSIVQCADASEYKADLVVVGIGIVVNTELAKDAGLQIKNGIVVNEQAQTNDKDIYAIGDCSFHFNARYGVHTRLECVQHAVDQAKIAAANICGKATSYDKVPWFWSDQYDVKLQMIGLSQGYDKMIKRVGDGEPNKFSLWYFKEEELVGVDAVNDAKAYVIGTKSIKTRTSINRNRLADSSEPLSWKNLTSAGN